MHFWPDKTSFINIKMNLINTTFLSLLFLPICASFEGLIYYNASHNQCDCCSWKLRLVTKCDHPSNTSFDKEDLTLGFFMADATVKRELDSLTRKQFNLVGIGTGLRHAFPYHCSPDGADGSIDWQAWSINDNTRPTLQGGLDPWHQFSQKLMTIIQVRGGISSRILKFLWYAILNLQSIQDISLHHFHCNDCWE